MSRRTREDPATQDANLMLLYHMILNVEGKVEFNWYRIKEAMGVPTIMAAKKRWERFRKTQKDAEDRAAAAVVEAAEQAEKRAKRGAKKQKPGAAEHNLNKRKVSPLFSDEERTRKRKVTPLFSDGEE